ncbi:DUF2381 family protein [Archangium violaceum]|uniref:DUF2381 family protein n=1 Tax=Archangium violaceum TaxID=83451 RepID=UPI00193B0740|nr:DUF2381 family protein [Archangium violaceum]QRK06292.1 DUF2381 family protein [Archangium violaceum]
MSVLSPAALVALVLLAGASAIAQPRLPDCEASPSRVELPAEPTGKVQEVCISPELPITFRFDSLLVPGSLELQERERFEDVAPGTRSFTLHPPADLQTGERFKVTVRFADGAAPTSATFMLVGHPALGTRQVNVFRHKRTVEDYQKETQEERKKSQQLGLELERMRLEKGPSGLTGLIASGLMVDDQGVKAEDITKGITRPASNALAIRRVLSYRGTTREENVVRVAVAVELVNPGTQPWAFADAALVSKGQEPKPMKVGWQPSPVPPNPKEPGVVVVDFELTAREAQGPFTLKLWDESGMRLVTIGNVTFP